MTNSQADRKIKKLLDDMARNGSTFTSTEDLMKTIGGIIDKYGESEDWEIGVADEATVCIDVLHFASLLSFLPYSDKIEGGRGKAPGSPLLICGAEWRS